MVQEIKAALQDLSIPEKAAFFPYFFKTGKGEYGEGDEFIGVTVPDQRMVAKDYFQKISLPELEELLSSKIHEHRHCAVLMLVAKFDKAKNKMEQKEIIKFYVNNKKHLNNWDLVDSSSYKILGRYCFENQDDSILFQLSEEENLWSNRIAVVSTLYHVRKGFFETMKKLVLKNLNHEHDLMHKANGWLLREMGKKDEDELLHFLAHYYQEMPRTSLRYSIEKLEERLRQKYLKGEI